MGRQLLRKRRCKVVRTKNLHLLLRNQTHLTTLMSRRHIALLTMKLQSKKMMIFKFKEENAEENKKPRVEPPVPMSEAYISSILSEAREKLDLASSEQPLEFEKFEQFMIESRGSKNVVELAASFSDEIEYLTSMIDLIYPYINNPVLKSRCTKLKKKLLPDEKGGTDKELDTSSSSNHDSQ
ncbi:hypothetical protein QAD02_011539 [Eretmocerus hayati]|uniref:Uncharacterized protein n=1 Tax=Eretmocerus hayati TaxID=131215 RepID=A0ACC2NY19_9HYME|nr:hypothetical protein QAD02_011539 [Eretmocerus hayati]